ncbi:MAG TPA: CHASE2 domain-containing protein, partial [Allocoleopsis sp.]
DWGRRIVAIWAVTAATATAFDLGVVQWLERQTQTLFFEIRGPVAQPSEVVILTIDDSSLSQGEFFRADPQKYAALEPIQAWPWQRSAYAIAINKLMAAGARSIGIDVIFSTPSSYGDADDQQLAQAIQQHANQVILAAQYSESETPQGYITQLVTPLDRFCNSPRCAAFINFLIERDGRIHQRGEQFLNKLLQNSPTAQAQVLERRSAFAHAILDAARMKHPPATGNTISFYGPARTFEHIPFWYVLDPTTWKTTLQSGAYFKGKIVLIGATAGSLQDFHSTPFSESWLYPQPMPGVEIHANAIATLLEGKSIAEAIPHAALRGLFVFIGLGGAGLILLRPQSPLRRLNRAMALAGVWLGVGYVLFVYGGAIV